MPEVLSASQRRVEVQLDGDPRPGRCSVRFDGRRVWTFDTAAGVWDDGRRAFCVEWPEALQSRLTGTTELRLEFSGAQEAAAEREVSFGGSASRLELVDPVTGDPLVVNKWGRMGRSFEARPAGFFDRILSAAQDLIELVDRSLGIQMFVTGGTLLGPVRDGRLISSDDDADLAYLSRHENPSDVALESLEIERLLDREGFEMVRLSAGHIQVMFPGGTLSDEFYVDIFSYFVVSGYFHGTFHAREPAERVHVLPLTTIDVMGRQMPAPARPDEMLAAIYGESWRTPDPSFRFVTPPSAGDRFYWWLNHYDVSREDWEDHHRSLAGSDPAWTPSLAWCASRVGAGHSVLDVGSGLGALAHRLGATQRVLGFDYSRPAVLLARQSASGNERFLRANLFAMTTLVPLLEAVSELPPPVDVVANHIVDNLHPLGIDNLLFVCRHVLRGSGRAFLTVRHDPANDPARGVTEPYEWGEAGRDHLLARLQTFGVELEESEEDPGDGDHGPETRLVLRKGVPH